MAKSIEQVRAELAAKRQMGLPNPAPLRKPKVVVEFASYTLEEFLELFAPPERTLNQEDFWAAYELEYPNRRVITYRVNEAVVQLFYYEAENLEG